MGCSDSSLNVDLVDAWTDAAHSSNFALPDVSMEQPLQRFSFGDPDAALQRHLTENLARADSQNKLPEYFKEVGGALAPFTTAPNTVGIGVVFITMLLDVLLTGAAQPDEPHDIPAMLRRAFDNEKSEAILVAMDNYRKQHRINAHHAAELSRLAALAKDKISERLTALRRAMTVDDGMRSTYLKSWVGG